MMKQKIMQLVVAIAVTLIFSTNVKAQVWCPEGATWYYASSGQLGEGYSKFTYINDTIINGITCKKLTSYYKVFGPVGLYERHNPPKFVYSDKGVVYQYNNYFSKAKNKFDTLYDIRAKIGDKWHLPQVDTLCPDSMYCMEVLNIGTKTINAFNLKWLYVKIGPISMGGETKFYVFDTITERLGLITDGYLHSCPGFTESDQHRLRCYSDNSFGSYSTGISKTCDYVTSIKELKQDKIDIGMYPNPANDKIAIKLYSPPKGTLELRVYDLTGRLVQSKTFTKDTEIETSSLEEGVYTYSLSIGGDYLKSGKISVMH